MSPALDRLTRLILGDAGEFLGSGAFSLYLAAYVASDALHPGVIHRCWAVRRDRKAKAERLIHRLPALRLACLIARLAGLLWLTFAAGTIVGAAASSGVARGAVPTLVCLAGIVALETMAPLRRPGRRVDRVAPLLLAIASALRVLFLPLIALSRALAERAGSPDAAWARLLGEHGAPGDPLREEEEKMLRGLLEFRDAEVKEVMTPRPDMACVEVTASLEDAVRLAAQKGHSRLPVYEGTRDHIVGVLNTRDALPFWGLPGRAPTVREIMRPVRAVPETKHIRDLLRELQRERVHLAVVLDEYGGTAGVVTMEDILEEIVGEIHDEHEHAPPKPIRRIQDGVYEIDGRTPVGDVNEILPVPLPKDESYETIAGFVFARLGRIPAAGETLVHEGMTIAVLEVDRQRIVRVRVSAGEAS